MGSRQQVAVFPIPGMVCFPGQILRLHIFEPRYRQMVKDCLKNDFEVGVALPKRQIKEGKSTASSVGEILNSNQAVFEAHDIMGAGPVKLLEELEDGRYLIEVTVAHRVQLTKVTQELPYVKAEFSVLEEAVVSDQDREATFDELLSLCREALEDQFVSFEEQVGQEVFENKDLSELSFRVLDWCQLLPDQMQEALETMDPLKRAELLKEALEAYVLAVGTSSNHKIIRSEENSKEGQLIHVDFRRSNESSNEDSE